ncbi:hypothetical protein BCV70DRAFT_200416 [Testicularia cyperi]|uniref:Transcription factor TFIIIC triple barrel domain-containing protein n=1 Tax=Testicularia cyperi TaxID=1882483 RepID=A0A317XQU4_9BASI|nr:hypothetical protein BCV70DRAFT_200416 [Testicularia cyperi]
MTARAATAAAASPGPSRYVYQQPIIDSTWNRVPKDAFLPSTPFASTPFYENKQEPIHAANNEDGGEDDDNQEDASSEWSYDEETELVTLDLGSELAARRALLGFSAPLNDVAGGDGTSGAEVGATTAAGQGDTVWSARNIRVTRTVEPSRPSTSLTTSALSLPGATPLGAGKDFSLTGLDTLHPIVKIGSTVLRGKRQQLVGSEIVLVDHFDRTKHPGSQHLLRPIPPSSSSSSSSSSHHDQAQSLHPTTVSSTTRTRILCHPIFDPADREALDSSNPLKPDSIKTPGGAQMGKAANAGGNSQSVSFADPPHEQPIDIDIDIDVEDTAQDESLHAQQPAPPTENTAAQSVRDQQESLIQKAESKVRRAARALHRKQMQQQQQAATQDQEQDQDRGQNQDQDQNQEQDQDQA